MSRHPVALFTLASTLAASAGPRVANTTITLPSEPPASVIEVQTAFPGLSFSSPLCLRSPDGDTKRLFICEKTGDLELVPDVSAANPTKTIFLDLDQILASRGESLLTGSEQGLLSVAFHPDYQNNGSFFIVYNVSSGGTNYQRLSRWHDPDLADTAADPTSEEILIEQRNDAGNHNGGDLHFGSDGYLYMSWGDEGAANDTLNNSQFLDKDFWSSITRIDVDLEPEDYTPSDGTGNDDTNLRPNTHPAIKLVNGNPLYEVPADNPWVGATTFNGVSVNPTQTRTEFFAVGLRNPWRFSFDNDELWIGDVGQGAREEVTIALIGSNHGWAWYEGDLSGPKFNSTINGASRTNSTHNPPVWDYARGNGEFQGNSITGGFVYRGTNIPSLTGKYIFGDYVSGNVWALERTDTPGEPEVQRIAGEGGLAGFGPDPSNGDILMADVSGNQIHRLVARDDDPGFPDTLSSTGIFSNLATLTPNPGVVPYDINLPFWSDHALKQRWFAIKNTSDLITYAEDQPWTFPNGMIWVKHFDLELERGNPATKKHLETRVLVRNQIAEVVSTSTLISEGASAKYLVPTNASLESTWMTTAFDDSSWPTANTGIGYDENSTYLSHFGTGGNLGNALNGQNTSFYLRVPFNVTDAASIGQLTLRMKYDDGFVAYFNGQRVTDANPPEDDSPPQALTWESEASGDNPDGSATSFQDFNISSFTHLLQDGQNILAIQGLNNGIGSSDMLITPELIGGIANFTDGIYGVSYKWNEAGTEATLVGTAGENIELTIDTPDGIQAQTWNIPSRSSCNTCHLPEAGLALSFNTPQLNRTGTIEGSSGNLLTLLFTSGYLDTLPNLPDALPKHIGPTETDYSLEARVRSYLDVNCAYCHQDPGIEPLTWKGNLALTIAQTNLINTLASGGTEHPDDRLVVPGNPTRSILLSRVAATNGYTRMPPLATNETDTANIQLLTDWILQEATSETTYHAWRIARFGNDTSPQGEPTADPDADGASNQTEWLTLTNPTDPSDLLTTTILQNSSNIEIDLPPFSNRSLIIQRSTDLSNWQRWTAPGNNALPRNPAQPTQTLTAPASGTQEFFRYQIEER
ncbi:MAG: PQQ-dependent sugar dehydrogenase [Verrucomicrobiaceae bacterium]